MIPKGDLRFSKKLGVGILVFEKFLVGRVGTAALWDNGDLGIFTEAFFGYQKL